MVEWFVIALTHAVGNELEKFRREQARADALRRAPKLSTAVERLIEKSLTVDISQKDIFKFVHQYKEARTKRRINVQIDSELYTKLFDLLVPRHLDSTTRQDVLFVGICLGLEAFGLKPLP